MIYTEVCAVWNGLILEKLCGIDVQMREFDGRPPDIITGNLIM